MNSSEGNTMPKDVLEEQGKGDEVSLLAKRFRAEIDNANAVHTEWLAKYCADCDDGFVDCVDYGDKEDEDDEEKTLKAEEQERKRPGTNSAGKRKDAPSVTQQTSRPTKWLKAVNGDKKSCVAPGGLGVLGDAMLLVMEYLAPRELFRVAFTCKALMDKVTTPMVVRSAIMAGSRSKATMDALHPLMKSQCIHVPSPLRLLRLANAKKCEAPECNNTNTTLRAGWGVNLCWPCIGSLQERPTAHVQMVDKRYLPSRWGKTFSKVILQHPRVAKHIHWRHMSKRLHFWCKELVSPSGETHGPLITVGQIDNVKEHLAKGDVGEEALLCVVLLEGAPEPREYRPFVEAYESSAAQAKLAEATRREEKERAKTSCKKGVKELLDTLRGHMDERWKECIFDHEMVDQWSRGGKRKQSTVKFHVGFVDDLLKPYVAAPSMAKKKKVVADLASEINQRMGQVWTLGRGQADAQQSENNAEPSTAHYA